MPSIQAYMGGFLSEEAAIISLETSKLTNQVCLKVRERWQCSALLNK